MKLLIFAMIFNFFSTWYFGWNWHPESPAEHASDHFVIMIAAIGFAQIILKSAIKKHEKKHHVVEQKKQEEFEQQTGSGYTDDD